MLAVFAAVSASAQTNMRVFKGGDSDKVEIQDMTFSDGTMTVGEKSYNVSDVDSIVMVQEVDVVFNGETATVTIPEVLKDDIVVTINGAHVNIINNNVANEAEFMVIGTTANGSLNYHGDYKCTFIFNNLKITNPDSAAVNLKCGKRVALELIGANTLVDGAKGAQKACLYCKGHMEIEGETGNTLSITANAKHGICTKEYLQLKKSTGVITFVSVADDAIHVGDGDDTIEERKEEYFQMNGGTINATMTNEDTKGIRVGGDVLIKGGNITINANGNGTRGIQTDGNMVISDEYEGTTITISAAGGKCTQTADSDDPHKCMGIKVDGNLTVNGGTTTVTNTGKKSKGIKVGGTYTKNGGIVNATIE